MSKKLEKAVAGLHQEIAKLEPKAKTAITRHLSVIREELTGIVGNMVKREPEWVGAPAEKE